MFGGDTTIKPFIDYSIYIKKKQMIRSARKFGLTAAKTVKLSQELDQLLNLKQKELLKQAMDQTQ
ncbi:aspartyl-phosphate phosphatase Spo0E family protein [Siminovitchia sp. FSL H7-0308]|uniref:Aspartyl-phosphate phosphatase Spo0E family protein n=1 Tax=Siminovitchia thermophila TaxID=1245522 RepID=A0ABS2R2I1_9BACI|nr:aspartyl-phosphate phosphatase Spo0E family protein [Siminovitchia thermophila]MBM7713860.1 hypothetical protein [Siminovitchia thermophila]ONK22507.1 hypothetical protein BLX87_15895 [Bacillus sp. VT-16-64]